MRPRGRILVTGASGFIGGHICPALLKDGWQVRALYRRPVPPPDLAALAQASQGRLEPFNADLGDRAAVARAVAGVDTVLHVAALASDWGPYEDFLRSNFEATLGLVEAARKAGVGYFVYISSAVVSGFGPHEESTEEGPYYPLKYPYQTTKSQAEAYVLSQDSPGFRTLALRPCNVYGPGDRTSTYAMYEAILSGVFGWIGSGKAYTCPIYIDDLCAGILAALHHEEVGGEAIILTDGQKVSWKDYVEAMYRALGSRRQPLGLPVPLAYLGAWLLTLGARLLGLRKAPPLTLYRVEQGSQSYHFSNAKARRLLGFEPKVFYEEGLARTAEAFLAERGRKESL